MLKIGFCSDQSAINVFLARQCWFRELDIDDRELVVNSMLIIKAKKNECILAAGVRSFGWYGVVSGLVKLVSDACSRKEWDYLGVGEDEWFGEGSLLKDEPRQYSVRAMRESEIVCMPSHVFEKLSKGSIAFNGYLVKHLNMRLGQALATLEMERTGAPLHRVCLALSRIFWCNKRTIELTQAELANFAGVSRQSANVVLAKLEGMSIIKVKFGKIQIIDDEKLMKLIKP